MIFSAIILLVLSVYPLSLYGLFVKAGVPGWRCFIPVHNVWKLFTISGHSGLWSILSLPATIMILSIAIAPVLLMGGNDPNIRLFVLISFYSSIIFLIVLIPTMIDLGTKFGKSKADSILFLILLPILTSFPIGFIIISLDKSKYIGLNSPEPALQAIDQYQSQPSQVVIQPQPPIDQFVQPVQPPIEPPQPPSYV